MKYICTIYFGTYNFNNRNESFSCDRLWQCGIIIYVRRWTLNNINSTVYVTFTVQEGPAFLLNTGMTVTINRIMLI